MDTNEIAAICKADVYMKNFIGVFPCDLLPKPEKVPFCLVANTDPSMLSGTHWVGIHVDENNVGTFFCSYGTKPNMMFQKYLNRCSAWTYSAKHIQGPSSTTCGQYVICFLHFRCRDVSAPKILSLFSKNLSENDEIVTSFINGLYDVDTTVFAPDF